MATVQVKAQLPRLTVEDQVVVIPEADLRRQLIAGAAMPSPGIATTSARSAAIVGIGAVAVVAAALAILVGLIDDPAFSQAPAAVIEGVTIFATFYVAAQAIERLLEPISIFLLPKEEKETDADAKVTEAANKVKLWAASVSTSQEAEARDLASAALSEAAQSKSNLEQRTMERTMIFWALATITAMWASASLHLYFLRTIGVTGAERWLEVLATGLIIGAGTKPLHDLITRISASAKTAEEDASETEV